MLISSSKFVHDALEHYGDTKTQIIALTLARECRDGVIMGFMGKEVSHVEMGQRLFSPSESRVDWAVRVLRANERAAQEGRDAWALDGKMTDTSVNGGRKFGKVH